MKKLFGLLSALSFTVTVVPSIVSCIKKELVLSSLTADSFKQLNIIKRPTIAGTIETEKTNDINDDQKLIAAIQDHIKIMTLKKIFCLESLIPKTKDDAKTYTAFFYFWDTSTTPPILDIKVDILETNKKYKITIIKEKCENITITSKDDVVNKDTIKPYYDLIKGEQVEITIDL